jgi:MFS family permease
VLAPGLLSMALGLLMLAGIDPRSSYPAVLLPGIVLIGIGCGLAFPAIMSLAMSGAAPEDAGLASGLVNTTLQMGGAIGLAVLATLSSGRTSRLLDGGDSLAAALTSGYRLAFLVAAGLLAAATAIALVVLEPVAHPGAAIEPVMATPQAEEA